MSAKKELVSRTISFRPPDPLKVLAESFSNLNIQQNAQATGPVKAMSLLEMLQKQQMSKSVSKVNEFSKPSSN